MAETLGPVDHLCASSDEGGAAGRAAALGQNPSLLVQTAPARWLVEEV
jgi:hypothetical protein